MQLQLEKDSVFSAQEAYQIISDAIDFAEEDGGFINSFIFERALYVCAARVLYEDKADEINTSLLEDGSPLITWDKLLEDGTIDKMIDEHKDTLDYLADLGGIWFQEYVDAAHSMRSLVDVVNTLMEGMAGNMGKQLEMFKNDAGIQNVTEIANKWGMNNDGGDMLGK